MSYSIISLSTICPLLFVPMPSASLGHLSAMLFAVHVALMSFMSFANPVAHVPTIMASPSCPSLCRSPSPSSSVHCSPFFACYSLKYSHVIYNRGHAPHRMIKPGQTAIFLSYVKKSWEPRKQICRACARLLFLITRKKRFNVACDRSIRIRKSSVNVRVVWLHSDSVRRKGRLFTLQLSP